MTNELKKYVDGIRDEIKNLYEADYTDEERDELEANGEAFDLWSYFADPLDYEFTISSRGDFLGVKVWVTLGGPNVWIDTREECVKGAWGSDREESYLQPEICQEIDSIFEEYYNITTGRV